MNDPTFWAILGLIITVVLVGGRLVWAIHTMNANLGNGLNGIHAMIADKLISIESMLEDVKQGVDGIDYLLSQIEDHTSPPPRPNPYSDFPDKE